MRQQYEADTRGFAEDGSGPRQQRDYSLKEGQTLRIALPDKVDHDPDPHPHPDPHREAAAFSQTNVI